MEYLVFILLIIIAVLPAAALTVITNQKEKRGCGRGCARCGNKEFCHRKKF